MKKELTHKEMSSRGGKKTSLNIEHMKRISKLGLAARIANKAARDKAKNKDI